MDLNKGPILIEGHNGAGKSNLLEALYMLAIAKPHRSRLDRECVNWNINDGSKFAEISGKVEKINRDLDVKVLIHSDGSPNVNDKTLGQRLATQNYKKTLAINGVNYQLSQFIGEVNEQEKNELLGNALGLLFPIAWPEPFGLVMIEAMACGTPVIAYRNGAVPEVMKHHFTGYIVDSVSEAVEAVHNLHSISREYCRDYFVRRFSAEAMAKNYISLYERQIFKARSLFNPALEAVV